MIKHLRQFILIVATLAMVSGLSQNPISVPKAARPAKSTKNKKPDSKVKTKQLTNSIVKDETDYNNLDYVDLGLPSDVKWATTNVGAQNPEEYGDYYAWMEVVPKAKYTLDNYDFHTFRHLKNISRNAVHDVARHNMGGSWRLPTTKEWNELVSHCTWKWCEINGVGGIKGTARNGNTIFFPAAGKMQGGSTPVEVGKQGYYMGAERGIDEFKDLILFFNRHNGPATTVKTSTGQPITTTSTQMIDGHIVRPAGAILEITAYSIYEGVSVRGVTD